MLAYAISFGDSIRDPKNRTVPETRRALSDRGKMPRALFKEQAQLLLTRAKIEAEAGRALSVQGLRKSFGARVAVDGLSLSISSGEIDGLLGPNGEGKTTSISMIAGILERDEGRV